MAHHRILFFNRSWTEARLISIFCKTVPFLTPPNHSMDKMVQKCHKMISTDGSIRVLEQILNLSQFIYNITPLKYGLMFSTCSTLLSCVSPDKTKSFT